MRGFVVKRSTGIWQIKSVELWIKTNYSSDNASYGVTLDDDFSQTVQLYGNELLVWSISIIQAHVAEFSEFIIECLLINPHLYLILLYNFNKNVINQYYDN